MRRLSIFIFLFVLSKNVFTQNNYTGKVINDESRYEIFNVTIVSGNSTFSTTSNKDGLFVIPKSGIYSFFKEGYKTLKIFLKKEGFTTIKLKPSNELLDEVIINSNNFNSKLFEIPSAISVLTQKEISATNGVNIAPIINNVSGVFMHNGTLTTNRLTIRGIGSRNLYGTSKIRAYYQDIPLTNGTGASTIEDIEISTLGKVEILKGPSSSIYGAGLGGTIQLIPDKGYSNENSISTGFNFGSFGFKKHLIQVNVTGNNNTVRITYSNINSDGYRENNNTFRQTVTIVTNHYLNKSNRLIFVGNFIDLKAYIPSSLNLEDYTNNPAKAAFTWNKSKGHEDYKKGLFGLSWQHRLNNNTKHYTSVFYSFLNSYEARPFNILGEKVNGFGIRTRIANSFNLFNGNFEWTLGGEIFTDSNSYHTYNNLYNQTPNNTGSIKGEELSNFKQKSLNYNLFFDSKYNIAKNTIASLGFNINQTNYALNDYFFDDKNQSGKYSFNTILSPKIGINYLLKDNASFYTSLSHGFSPPTIEETLLPNGLINSDIKPESGWNYEIGSRGSMFNNKVYFDLALYKMAVKNLLVARRTNDDQFIGINAGKTTYNGIEITSKAIVLQNEKIKIDNINTISFNDFRFNRFIDDGKNYSGNQLTGVPKKLFNSTVNFESKNGFYGFIKFKYVGKIPLRDDNSIYSKNYQLLNSKIGYKKDFKKKLQLDTFIGFNNILNQKYASMLLINASSFRGKAPRYYYPGEPFNIYAGINLKYVFLNL